MAVTYFGSSLRWRMLIAVAYEECDGMCTGRLRRHTKTSVAYAYGGGSLLRHFDVPDRGGFFRWHFAAAAAAALVMQDDLILYLGST